MRWRRCGRRAISTMIGGIIVLTLLLSALGTMIFLTQQYDAYQSILNTMSQKDTERFSENIAAVYPGIFPSNQPVACGGSSCNQYTMALSNDGPIEVQIARIYVNSTSVCTNICVFDPSNTTAPYKFQGSESLIDSGESNHFLTFWLPATLSLPVTTDANSIGLVTSRGRVFTFQWTFPQGVAVPSELRLDMGPLRIIYDSNLVAFTETGATYGVPGPNGCANQYPSATPCYQAGWDRLFPSGQVIFYVRISNIGNATVTLLDGSYLLADGVPAFGGQPNPVQFYIVQPMSAYCWSNYFHSSYFGYGQGWDTSSNACSTPSSIKGYNATKGVGQCNLSNPCYQLQNATDSVGVPGQQTYILFSAQTINGIIASSLLPSYNYFLYLELSYTYWGYEYSTSLPLIVIST